MNKQILYVQLLLLGTLASLPASIEMDLPVGNETLESADTTIDTTSNTPPESTDSK